MSYEIVYDRKFIKTTRGIIPMVLIGSSNDGDTILDSLGRLRYIRGKHWSTLHPAMIENEEEQTKWINAASSDPEAQIFMTQSKNWVKGSDVRKWFDAGVRTAMPLEDLLRWNPRQSFRCMVTFFKEKEQRTESILYPKTTAELESWIDEVRSRQAVATPDMGRMTISMGFTQEKPLKAAPSLTGPVVAKYRQSYISNYERTPLGCHYTLTPNAKEATVFPSQKAAEEILTSTLAGKIKLLKADTAQQDKRFFLQISGGWRNGYYISRVTKGHMHYTSSREYACGYCNLRLANAAKEKFQNRFDLHGATIEIIDTKGDSKCESEEKSTA